MRWSHALLGLIISRTVFADPSTAPLESPATVEQRLEHLEESEAYRLFRASPPLHSAYEWRRHRRAPSYTIYRGNELLDHEDFYHLVGRDDLAAAYHRRVRVGESVALAGLCGIIGGILAGYAVPHRDGVALGLVLGTAGSISTMTGLYMLAHPEPTSPAESEQLVNDYNDREAIEEVARWKLSVRAMPGGATAGVGRGF